MAYRRPRRFTRRPRRTYRRRPYRRRRTRVPRNRFSKNGFSQFQQKWSYTEVIPAQPLSTGSFTAWDTKFTLSDIPIQNLTALTRLYRYWRLTKVHITFQPTYIGYDITTGVPTSEQNAQALISGTFMSAFEPDSNQMTPNLAVWADESQANEHSSLRKKYLSPQTGNRATAKVTLRPRANNFIRSLASSSTGTATLLPIQPWISTASPSTELYGLRFAYQVLNAHPAFDLQIKMSYTIQVKGVK